VSAAKKLLDTGHPAFKAVSAVRHRIVSLFKGMSLPYPEPGVRLIRQEDIALFNVQMQTLKAELEEAVTQLDEQYAELRSAARRRLGSLYDAGDYPESLDGLFDVQWDFPAFEPPNYLRQLSPELYEQECQRVAGRFDEAVRMAEEAFTEELAKLTSHLTERLAGAEDGKQKVFRDSAIENLTEFFDRFRHLSLNSDSQLDELVDQAQRVVRGVGPQQLRDDQTLRQHVATELSAVQSVLDGLLVDRPRRNILRRPK
jgi:tetratricopeptide (TPR) repeat protein